jgi:hypothetical protein
MTPREPKRLTVHAACAIGLTLAVYSCGGGGDVGPGAAPSSIVASSGNGQSGDAGAPLSQPIVVRVTASSGSAVEGVSVSFSAAAGSGTVGAATVTTDADGKASTNWTVGSQVGTNLDTVFASVSGVPAPAVFTATVNPGAAASMESVAGDAQNGFAGVALPQPLVVVVRDQFGNPRSNVDVSWSVTSGGGSIAPAISTTGSDGRASASWTPGSQGVNTAQATVAGLGGSPVNFGATAATLSGSVTVTAVSPTPMVEGQPATLTGTGFGVSPGDNKVKIEGVAATVTAASATSLTVTVPTFDCQPARSTPVQVSVAAETSNVLAQGLNPSAFTAVGVGQELLLQNPAEFCLQFAPATSSEDYLIGVQSTSDVVSSLTPVSLTSVAAAGQPSAAPLAELRRSASSAGIAPTDPTLRLRRQRTVAEAKFRQEEREQIYPLLRQVSRSRRQTGVRALAAAIPPALQAGDTVPIRYPGNGNLCTSFVEVKTVVRVVGQRGIWLEDIENPAGGLTQADIQQLSDEFDARIYGTVTDYFGSPTDLDHNQRIAIVLTRQVNKIRPGVAGHVGPQDLVPRSICASSDDGEIYYSVVPDPAGTLGDPVSREVVMAIAIQTIAHEFTHIIQLGQRFILHDLEPDPVWMLEGQAMLAEEITGHVYEGRSPGQNYGFRVAFNQDDPSSIDWYSQPFVGLFYYFGFMDRESKVPHAPEECTWLAPKPANPGPCLGNLDVYGAPWSLLRWMSDQFGSRFPNGEKGLHQALILSPATGYDALAAVSGVPAKTLLAQWAAMLYVDDRVPGAAASLTLPSWNLLDISNAVVESAQLIPEARTFSSYTDQFNVRAASSAYFRVSGTARPGTAIRVRSRSDAPLPANMQVFVVRLQ